MTRKESGGYSDLVEAINRHATPLWRDSSADDSQDVGKLLDIFRTKTVIGMGEATHGTRAFAQLRHRLVELLVQRLGLRVIASETNFSETLAINRFVVSGEGDPTAAITSIPAHVPTWETEELRVLVEWLRDYNTARPKDDRVRFFGFDAQFAAGAATELRRYLQSVDSRVLDSIDATLRMLEAEGLTTEDGDVLNERLEKTGEFVSKLRSHLQENEHEWIDAFSEAEWRLANRHLRIVEQVKDLSAIDPSERPFDWYEQRDRAMAENVSWILDHEHSDRIALWGHNGHLARGLWQNEVPRMGTVLAEEFGDRYYAIGFEFGHGTFRAARSFDAGRLDEWSLEGAPPDAIATVFEHADPDELFLDLSAACADHDLETYLSRERLVHSIGSVFDPAQPAEFHFQAYSLIEAFDGLLFVEETEGARPLEPS